MHLSRPKTDGTSIALLVKEKARTCAGARAAACYLGFAFTCLSMTMAGCAGKGQLVGGSSANSMKTTLSHLQFENEQLKTEVAKLKEENRSIEDRLVQEQVHNGDLAAKLDNARNLLKDQDRVETRVGSRSSSDPLDGDDSLSRSRSTPAKRTSRPRKPPAASIPGELDAQLPSASDRDDDTDSGTISFKTPGSSKPRAPSFDEPSSPGGDPEKDLIWQPVARGTDTPPAPARR